MTEGLAEFDGKLAPRWRSVKIKTDMSDESFNESNDSAFEPIERKFTVSEMKIHMDKLGKTKSNVPILRAPGGWTLARFKSYTMKEPLARQLPPIVTLSSAYLSALSVRLFNQRDYSACYVITKKLLDDDPFMLELMPVHLASLVHLEKTTEIYFISTQLMQQFPNNAVSWFASGCYYFLLNNLDSCRRFFGKAKAMDSTFLAAWLAYGHSLSLREETDHVFYNEYFFIYI
eukprot:GHVL01016217.1.p1 GENE.GHVL01016217.1~~GHVL01016217.1.p1  ORF type:complete len:231 (+),score=37.17 GHVL01016217.1:195-887(+)